MIHTKIHTSGPPAQLPLRLIRPADMHTYDIYTSASGSVPAATAVKAATPLLAIAAYAGEQHEAPVTFGYLGYDLATLVIAGLTIIAVRAADDAITAAA